jgi:hypothetical protein
MASKILKEVFERVETWPEERQNDAAKVLIEMEQQDAHSIGLTDAQAKEIERRLAKDSREFLPLEEAHRRVAIRRT